MGRTGRKMLGMAIAVLGLVATLAGAEDMTCTKDNGAGTCIAAVDAAGKTVVVVGESLKVGDTMDCTDRGNLIACHAVVPASPPLPTSEMTCAKDDGAGTCIAAESAEGKTVIVVGTGVKRGEKMTCVERGSVTECQAI
jgi:hypothetical protein